MPVRALYVCNAFEETVRKERGIETDAPAVSKKVALVCDALGRVGCEATIVSLGRGRQKGRWRWHPPRQVRDGSNYYRYAGFLNAPLLTHITSAFALVLEILRSRVSFETVVIFYNPQTHYFPALLVARILGAPCVLDLEDGLIAGEEGGRAVVQRVMLRLYNRTCSTGILLACRDLATQVPFRSHYVCYGVAPQESPARLWQSPLQFHLGGALYRDTGTVLFLEALEILRRRYPETVPKVRFTVTGFGPMAGEVERIASSSPDGWLRFLGKVDEDTYGEILQRSHVGLCLKLPGSGMGATTFPSKVVDMAGHGLLILSTRVSDVPELFPPGSAMLLDNPGAEALAETIARITAEPELARKTAERGQELIRDRLSPEKVGKELRHFLFKVSERGGHPR